MASFPFTSNDRSLGYPMIYTKNIHYAIVDIPTILDIIKLIRPLGQPYVVIIGNEKKRIIPSFIICIPVNHCLNKLKTLLMKTKSSHLHFLFLHCRNMSKLDHCLVVRHDYILGHFIGVKKHLPSYKFCSLTNSQ